MAKLACLALTCLFISLSRIPPIQHNYLSSLYFLRACKAKNKETIMPAIRTRDAPVQRECFLVPPSIPPLTSIQALEVALAEPVSTYPILNVISPTPRAFTFPMNVHSPSPSPSNSPFDPDLRTLTFSTPPPPHKTHTPSSSISSMSSLTNTTSSSLSADVPATPPGSHRRRRSTVSDISERRPKKGDEDYIKRPENAFILFRRKCCEDRNLAQGAGDAGDGDGSPTKKQRQADLSKTISQQWKCLSPEERQYWEDLAKEKKVRTFRLLSRPFPSLCLTVSAERARGHVSQLRLPPSARQG